LSLDMFGEHPSKSIRGVTSQVLAGKKIILCITGSVAAIQSPIIARELMRHGAEIFTVMTRDACYLIKPELMEWATGNPVVKEITGKIEHILFAGEHEKTADLVLIAPATANTINKIAYGICDTPVTLVAATALGSGVPIVIVPAMHTSLYKNPILLESIDKLKRLGVIFLGPRIEEDKAKIERIDVIVEKVIEILTAKKGDLRGIKILVTAGPTREYIDAIRFISNPSTGKMGIAICEEAISRGANVTLIYGPGTAMPPPGIRVLRVTTTEEMVEAVVSELKNNKYDVFISTAAVLDYGPETKYDEKLPSGLTDLVIKLKPLPKVVNAAREADPDVFIVGFKAEYNVPAEVLVERAYDKLRKSGMDLIVANDVGREKRGFESDTNEVYIIDRDKNVIHVPLKTKREVAREILNVVAAKLRERSKLPAG